MVDIIDGFVFTENAIYQYDGDRLVKKANIGSGTGGSNKIYAAYKVSIDVKKSDGSVSSNIRWCVCTTNTGVILYDSDFSNGDISGRRKYCDGDGKRYSCYSIDNVLVLQPQDSSAYKTIYSRMINDGIGTTDGVSGYSDFISDGGSLYAHKSSGEVYSVSSLKVEPVYEDSTEDPTTLEPTEEDVTEGKILKYDGKFYVAKSSGTLIGTTTTDIVTDPSVAVV